MPELTDYLWIVWLALALAFVTIELLTLEFTFLMLAAGALLGGLGVNLLGGPWWLQIAVAAVLSALLLFTIRPLLLRVLRGDDPPVRTNVDALSGIGGRVVAAFEAGRGSVRLDNGETWTARLHESDPTPRLDVGDRVVVDSVHGATVEVVRAPLNPAAGGEEVANHE